MTDTLAVSPLPAVFEPRMLSWPDYVLLILYFIVNLGVGHWCARRKQNSSGDFFLDGKKMVWWASAISYFATATSSISFMALPATSYRTDWLAAGSAPAQAFAGMLVGLFFVHLLRELNHATVFGYLERRFDRRVRWISAALAIMLKIFGRMSVVLLLPALALSTVTGLNVYASICVMGAVTTIYSMEGGFKAVVWTDVLQAAVMAAGVSVAVWFLVNDAGGLGEIIRTGNEAGKFRLVAWEWDLSEPTFIVFAGMFVATVFINTADQPLMQRSFATATLRQAQRTVIVGNIIGLLTCGVFFFTGTALWAYYRKHPERLADNLPNDVIFPYFIVNELPTGFVGLIVAGLFAVSMGALSSAMNSTAAILVTDFHEVLRPAAPAARRMRFARRSTLACGMIATLMASFLAYQNVGSLWETFLKLIALIGGGIPGVFALGLLTRRANAPGVIVGAVASIGFTCWVQFYTTTNVFLHGFVALASCMTVGYVASILLSRWVKPQPLLGLTIWDRNKSAVAA